jgi:hypothetical protein
MNMLNESMQEISCTDAVLKSGGWFMGNFANGLRK